MAKIKIKIESDMGDTQFYSPPVDDEEWPMLEQPYATEKKVIRELLVGMVRRIYKSYDIPVTVLSDAGTDQDQAEKLGEAILAVVQRWGIGPLEPKALGDKVLGYMAGERLVDTSPDYYGTTEAFNAPPRPIKDSPQA